MQYKFRLPLSNGFLIEQNSNKPLAMEVTKNGKVSATVSNVFPNKNRKKDTVRMRMRIGRNRNKTRMGDENKKERRKQPQKSDSHIAK